MPVSSTDSVLPWSTVIRPVGPVFTPAPLMASVPLRTLMAGVKVAPVLPVMFTVVPVPVELPRTLKVLKAGKVACVSAMVPPPVKDPEFVAAILLMFRIAPVSAPIMAELPLVIVTRPLRVLVPETASMAPAEFRPEGTLFAVPAPRLTAFVRVTPASCSAPEPIVAAPAVPKRTLMAPVPRLLLPLTRMAPALMLVAPVQLALLSAGENARMPLSFFAREAAVPAPELRSNGVLKVSVFGAKVPPEVISSARVFAVPVNWMV